MKKKLFACLTAAVLALALTACGGKNKDVTVDIAKLADELKGTVTSGQLADVSSDILASTYFFDMEKIEESTAALNSGANSCEVAVVKCSDSKYVAEAEKLFQTRVDNQAALFETYAPEEVTKLDAALIKSAGNYVAFCVTDDTAKAEEILKKAGF